MHISRIKVENFRNLKNLEINLRKHTVIVGENNVGKSNLLDGLALILGWDSEDRIRNLSSEDIFYSQEEERNPDNFRIEIDLVDFEGDEEIKAAMVEGIYEKNGQKLITIVAEYSYDSEQETYQLQTHFDSPSMSAKADTKERFLNRHKRWIPLFVLDAVRDVQREVRATGRTMLSRILNVISLESERAQIEQAILEVNKQIMQNKDLKELSGQLSGEVSHIIGEKGDIGFSITALDSRQLLQRLDIAFSEDEKLKPRSIRRLGTGVQNLIMFSVFSAYTQRPGSPKLRPIFAIEEPEVHLHPHLQRAFYGRLKELETQSIVTTHSPTVAGFADPRDIIILRKDGNNIKGSSLSPSILEEDFRVIKRYIQGIAADIYFCRKAIFVEGFAEQILFPFFAHLLGWDLNVMGVSVIPVGGNENFGSFIRAVKGDSFNIPFSVIYDNDSGNTSPIICKQLFNAGIISGKERDKLLKEPSRLIQDLENKHCYGLIENLEDAVIEALDASVLFEAINAEFSAIERKQLEPLLKLPFEIKSRKKVAEFIQEKSNRKIRFAWAIKDRVEKKESIPPQIQNVFDKILGRGI